MNGDPATERDFRLGHYDLSRVLFLRALGVVQLIALGGLFFQLDGLLGSSGITPVAQLLDHLRTKGTVSIWQLPTLFWIDSSDLTLKLCLGTGILGSIAVAAGIWTRTALFIVWITYLSLVSVGWVFLRFQWDSLLLEATLIAIVVASPAEKTRTLGLFLVRCLLFRLMFCSGAVKLASGDPEWRNLHALSYHYFTQPLPNVAAYYLERLPSLGHSVCTAIMFGVELIAPLLIWARLFTLRRIAAALLITFQIILILSGNYAFLNLLTIVLCIPLLDDTLLRRFRLPMVASAKPGAVGRESLAAISYAIVAVIVGAGQLVDASAGQPLTRPILGSVEAAIDPFHMVNGYGLFAVMTTERREIEIEGSNDGEQWTPYRFRWKPDDVHEAPRQVAPYHPRLDWQMWFAALGDIRGNRWVLEFLRALLEGREPVLSLIEPAPFDKPPRFVRALLFRYEFSRLSMLEQERVWWKRELIGVYCPPISLEMFSPRQPDA